MKSRAVLGITTTFSSAFYQWAVLVAIAKFDGITTAGYYALAAAVHTPIFVLAAFSLRETLVTDYSMKDSFQRLFHLRQIASAAAGFLSFVLLTLSFSSAWKLFLAWSLLRAWESWFDFVAGLHQRGGDYISLALSSLVRNVALPIILYALLFISRDTTLSFSVYAVVPLIFFVIFERPRLEQAIAAQPRDPSLDTKPFLIEAWHYISRSAPVTVALFLSLLNTSIPRFVSAWLLSPQAVGLFGALFQLATSFTPLLTGLVQAFLPRLGQAHYRGEERAFLRAAHILVLCASLCSAVILILNVLPIRDALIRFILSSEFIPEPGVFFPLSLAAAALYLINVLGPANIAKKNYRNELIQNLCALVLTIIGTLIGALTAGLPGVCWGLALAQAVRALWVARSVLLK